MLLIALLTLSLFPFCFASIDATRDELVKLSAANNGLIYLDERTFNLLTSPKRDWSATIQLTAMSPKRHCSPCKEFDPSFKTVAKAWSTVPAADRDNHFFGTLDFDNGVAVFQKLGLQSAPIVHNYPATEGPRKPGNGRTAHTVYDFGNGFDAGPLAEQLSHHTPVTIPYQPPFDYAKWGTITGLALLGVVGLRFISPVLKSRWVWAAGTVLSILWMIAGYMFTRIRGSPHDGGKGQWIAPGYQNQFGQETQVVSMIYGLLGFAFLMLSIATPYTNSPTRQRLQVYLWSIVIFIMYSVLISLFRVKNRGYPFKLAL